MASRERKASVTSYLPYKKGVYFREDCDRDQISVVAEGLRRMRQRKKAVEALQSSHDEQHLWKCVVAFQAVNLHPYYNQLHFMR